MYNKTNIIMIKKYILSIISSYFIIITSLITYANEWLLEWIGSKTRIRTWDIHLDDIPNVIKSLIDIFLWIAWTVSVIFVIVWAYKLLFGSLQWDHTKWRETIIMAITGFAISVLAWFVVKFIFNNFS